jgi:hypothetical protein
VTYRDGSQSWSQHCAVEKHLCPGRELNSDPTAYSPGSILTELLRLLLLLLLLLMMMMMMTMMICEHGDVTDG